MILYVFAIRDKKLGAYQEPVCRREDKEHVVEMTIRGLKTLSKEQIPEAKDNALYYLGTWDDLKGKYCLLDEPEKLFDYEDYVPREAIKDEQGNIVQA